MFKYLVFCVILWAEIQTTILADNQSSDKHRLYRMVLHLQQVDWFLARKMCQEEGGDLAVVRSNTEENIILKMMFKYSLEYAWLGVKWSEGNWVTVSGEPLNSTGWTRWYNDDANKGCMGLLNSGGMFARTCGLNCGFVCWVPISDKLLTIF